MAKYIEKAALIAEIDRRMQCYRSEGCEPNSGKWVELISIKHFINNFKATEIEINLKEEIDKELETRWKGERLYPPKFRESAEHFFKLRFIARKGNKI